MLGVMGVERHLNLYFAKLESALVKFRISCGGTPFWMDLHGSG